MKKRTCKHSTVNFPGQAEGAIKLVGKMIRIFFNTLKKRNFRYVLKCCLPSH